jgi:hypothetical protein
VDIFVDGGDKNRRVYELKVTNGRIVDLYQLLAGWDGLVKEGIFPTTGVLVVESYAPNLQSAVDAANKRKDDAGNPYVIELHRKNDLVPKKT